MLSLGFLVNSETRHTEGASSLGFLVNSETSSFVEDYSTVDLPRGARRRAGDVDRPMKVKLKSDTHSSEHIYTLEVVN